jgi:hypothetical protein
MLRKIVGVFAALIVAIGLAAPSTSASASTPVTIQSRVDLATFTGTWTASGGINDSGTLVEPRVNFVANQQLHIVRDVTGALGTFTLGLQSTATPRLPDGSRDFTGQWVVITGTGAYANLHGVGTRVAVADKNGIVTETLTGEVHYD